jgi:hypothetical protein
MIKGRILAAVAATIALFGTLALAGPAAAQYPEPDGDLFCATSDLTVKANGTAVFTVTLLDDEGNPVVGKLITFVIEEQPGGASLTNVTDVTDGNGDATTTVITGSNPGKIVVAATFDQKKCRAELEIERLPVVEVLAAPKTGNAGLIASGGKGSETEYIALGSIVAIVVLSLGLLIRSHGPVWQGGRRDYF